MTGDDFEAVWKAYPRKVAKHPARLVWARMNSAEREAAVKAIPLHCAFWTAQGTEPQYVPHLRTWLYQRRWEDEIEMPQAAPKQVTAWWATDEGVMEQGRKLGIAARPGEGMQQYKARLVAAMRVAA